MKYATLLLGFAILLAGALAARAEPPEIPAAYRGTWCEISNLGNAREYKRCRATDGEQDWQIQARRITNGEAICTPLAVVAKRGSLSVRAECRTADWKDVIVQDMQLSADGQRLLIKD